jgi:Methyltransferase domain
MAEYRYEGNELAIFAQARHWKQYWISQVAPFIKGDVLEVGAGIGSNTMRLRHLSTGRWLCLEPDERLLVELQGEVTPHVAAPIDVARGTVSSLPEDEVFDTALYIDVLEHIPDDVGEIAAVAKHIRSSGHIIVLSPAHQLLYSPFDRAIGHQRRYNRVSLLRCTPPNVQSIRVSYLDSVGYCLSLANRLVLRQSSPTLEQILFWDKYILPVSRFIDPVLGFRVGKSILGVWQASRDRRL